MECEGTRVGAAGHDLHNTRLEVLGGRCGVIVLGRDGAYAMVFNSKGMFRGVKNAVGVTSVAIYGE